MVHAVQKRLNINNHISIAAIDYIKKLFVYAFIVIRHVLSKCFAYSFFSSSSRRCFIKWVADTPNWAFTELLSVMRLT